MASISIPAILHTHTVAFQEPEQILLITHLNIPDVPQSTHCKLFYYWVPFFFVLLTNQGPWLITLPEKSLHVCSCWRTGLGPSLTPIQMYATRFYSVFSPPNEGGGRGAEICEKYHVEQSDISVATPSGSSASSGCSSTTGSGSTESAACGSNSDDGCAMAVHHEDVPPDVQVAAPKPMANP